MIRTLRDEWQMLRAIFRGLDRQTVVVLLAAIVLALLHNLIGRRSVFLNTFAEAFQPEYQILLSWTWWFAWMALFGFVLPYLILRVGFKRRHGEMGLQLGDWKFALFVLLLYAPVVVIGTWFLSDRADFQAQYPHFGGAAYNWNFFLIYQALFLCYWIGWEYLWRGFVLFGTAHTFGYYAIIIQMLPFAAFHAGKPAAEMFLSVLGGLLIGAIVWRCRAFWVAVPIHAVQMLSLDLWCTLRIRTGVSGVGPQALVEMLARM